MTETEIRQRLEKLPGWILNKCRLERTFSFHNFARAAVFFNKIVNPIEEHQLYPQIFIVYNRLTVSLLSPEAGVLTHKDFLLAEAISALA